MNRAIATRLVALLLLVVLALVAYALVLGFSIFLSAWPGNKGSNRFGAPPA